MLIKVLMVALESSLINTMQCSTRIPQPRSDAVDADVELTISPEAADVAVVAAVSKVSLSFYFHIII